MKIDEPSEIGLDETIAIKLSDLTFGDPIGRGGFGEVLIGTWFHTRVKKTTVAIKRLLAKEISENVLSEFKNEVAVHVELDHSNIVKLFGITVEQPYCMVMEYMSNGSLFSYLEKNPQTQMTWDMRLTIGGGIVDGMAYLHGLNPPIIHGDLKSLNVLLDENYNAKIADFGLSQLRLETASRAITNTSGQNGKGSLLWMAPELFERRAKKTLASDVYALGWTLWELAAHKCPFYEDHDKGSDVIIGYIKNNEREKFPVGTPQEYQILVEACWDGAIAKRPTARAALESISVLIKPRTTTKVKPSTVAPKAPSYMTETAPNLASGQVMKSNAQTRQNSQPTGSFYMKETKWKPAPTRPAPSPNKSIVPTVENSQQTSPSYMIESAESRGVSVSAPNAVKPIVPPSEKSQFKSTTLIQRSTSTLDKTKSVNAVELPNRYQQFNSTEEPTQQMQSSSQVKILNQPKATASIWEPATPSSPAIIIKERSVKLFLSYEEEFAKSVVAAGWEYSRFLSLLRKRPEIILELIAKLTMKNITFSGEGVHAHRILSKSQWKRYSFLLSLNAYVGVFELYLMTEDVQLQRLIPHEGCFFLSADGSYVTRYRSKIISSHLCGFCHHRFSLLLMSAEIKRDQKLVQEGELYLDEDGTYISRYKNHLYWDSLIYGKYCEPNIDLTDIFKKLSDSYFIIQVLNVTYHRGHTGYIHHLNMHRLSTRVSDPSFKNLILNSRSGLDCRRACEKWRTNMLYVQNKEPTIFTKLFIETNELENANDFHQELLISFASFEEGKNMMIQAFREKELLLSNDCKPYEIRNKKYRDLQKYILALCPGFPSKLRSEMSALFEILNSEVNSQLSSHENGSSKMF